MVETISKVTSGGGKQQRVRVKATSEDIRKYIKHPAGKIAFRATLDEAVEWPNDAFTKRRIRDGDVVLADAPAAEAPQRARTRSRPEGE